MAIAKGISIYGNGFNLACALKSFEPQAETESLDTTTLCANGWSTFAPGLRDGRASASGIWDSDTVAQNKIDDILRAAFNDGREMILTASLEPLAAGGAALLMNTTTQSYAVENPTGQLIMVSADFQSRSGIAFGKWLFNQTVASATVNGTGVDDAAATTRGGLLHAHHQKTTATQTSVLFQHSVNNSTWVDLGTVILAAANEAKSLEVAGTINRYVRAVVTATGGSASVQAALARK